METFVEIICLLVMLSILALILPTLIDIAITFALVMLVILGVSSIIEVIEETIAAHRINGAASA